MNFKIKPNRERMVLFLVKSGYLSEPDVREADLVEIFQPRDPQDSFSLQLVLYLTLLQAVVI